jgi:hypothetical protein
VFSFVDRVLRGSEAKAGEPAPLAFVLGLKWVVNSKAELMDVLELESVLRTCGVPNVVLDNVESGYKDVTFWLHVANPKRAFKELCEIPAIAENKSTLQAAAAERSKMKFSILWPKGNQVNIPPGLA